MMPRASPLWALSLPFPAKIEKNFVMLTLIRKHSKSWLVKILAGLLVASFAVWGVGDMFNIAISTSSTVFEIGDTEVEIRDMEDDIRREINRLRPILGNQFSFDEARSLGVIESVLQRRINDTALLLAARGLGVSISDDLVRNEIRNTPAFQSLGNFDRMRFSQVLNRNLLSEAGYIAMVRQQMGRKQLLDSFSAKAVPKILVNSLYRHRQEKRIADTVYISDLAQVGIPEPDTSTLEKFHKDNAVHFTAPEYRSLTVIRLEASEMAAELSVTEEELKQDYEAREDEFTTPETRQVLQMVFSDEKEAKKAQASLAAGKDFAAVAKDVAKMDASTIDLGKVTRPGLPFPELGDAVFALKTGENSHPIKSPLGWHVFKVTGMEQGGTRTLAEVRDELRKALALEKAIDGLFDLANKLEDALGSGSTLEEAAAQMNIKITKIDAVDKKGFDPSGRKIETLPGGDFMNIAFSTDEGSDSPLSETGSDGYFALRVDGVTPSVLRPLDSIKAAIIQAWKFEKRAEASKKLADVIVDRVNKGTGLNVIAKEMGLEVKTSPALTRGQQNDDSGLPQPLIARVFNVKPGKAALARSTAGFAVAQVKKIVPADPAKDQQGVKSLTSQMGDSLEADIMTQLADAFRNRFGVNINRQAVDSLFSGVGSSRRPASFR